ncbi:transporter substrate-binding domain-containing protein [Nocardioides caricicola]|uniref:Transporter substrate-binding domain-containing protein n=1 Tax=Nocardioides caricicola TaxID=634770 RepID=A0ABW0N2B0_9ACTN
MWPTLVLCLVVVLVLMFLVSRLTSSPVRPPKPVLVASGDWEPYVGADLAGGGPVSRIVSEVLERQGYAPEVTFSTWSLAEERTDRGSVIGGFPFVASESRQQDFLLSDPLLDFDYVLFVRRDDQVAQRISEPSDLAALRVAHVAGYDYWPELEAAVADFIEYPTTAAALTALANGDVDVVPDGLKAGEAALSAPSFLGDASTVEPLPAGDNGLLGSHEALHFMLPPSDENRRFLDGFNQALAAVKATDLYADAIAALDTSSGDEGLTVQAVGDAELAVLSDASGRLVLTPSGTGVRVLEWPDEFRSGVARVPTRPVMVEVKVLDGPSQGRILLADARALVLGGSGS